MITNKQLQYNAAQWNSKEKMWKNVMTKSYLLDCDQSSAHVQKLNELVVEKNN